MKKRFENLINKYKVEGELYRIKSSSQSYNFKNGMFSGVKDKYSNGISVRVINQDGKMGFSSAGGDELEKVFAKAVEVSQYTTPVPLKFLDDGKSSYKKIWKSKYTQYPSEYWIEKGNKIIERLKERIPDASVNFSVSIITLNVQIINSAGLDKEFEFSEAYLSASLAGAYGDNIVNSYYSLGKRNGDFEEDKMIEELTKEFLLAKKTVPFEGGKYPVIFTPTAISQVLAPLERGMSGYSVYKKLSPLTDKLGEQILSDKFSLRGYYEDEELVGVVPFDDEGTETNNDYYIQNGVLKKYLVDLEHSARLNLPPTGNAFRSSLMGGRDYKIMASSSFGSLKIDGGDVSEKELISSIKEGIYLRGSFDCWMGNILPGTLRGSLSIAYKIENGKLVGRIKNKMFSGNFYKMFGGQLEAVSDTPREGTLSLGSLFPAMLIKDLDIV